MERKKRPCKLGGGFDTVGIENFANNIRKVFGSIRKWIEGLEGSENIGKDFVLGIVNGIKNALGSLVETIINIGKTMIETVCSVLGIHSPSTEGEAVGEK